MNAFSASSGWRWLALCATVLLAHFWVLQALYVNLSPAQDVKPRAEPNLLTFETRTIAAPTPLMPKRTHAAVTRKPRLRPKPALAQPATQTANVVTTPAQKASAPEPVSVSVSVSVPVSAAEAEPNAELEPANVAIDNTVPDAAQANAPQQAASEVTTENATDALSTTEAISPRPPREEPLRVNANAVSSSTRLRYVVNTSKFPYLLDSELLWHNNGDTYDARLRFSAFGRARVQTSRGRITDNGLAPEHFSDKYRSEVAAHFNYLAGKVTFSANTPDAPLLAGAQDRLSVLVQLATLLASEPERFMPGMTLTIPTVGPRAADLWLFTVVATESLTLPGGDLEGIKLERLPREPYDQKVELWMSPQLSYLPARIRITETNGDSIDQQWQTTEPAGDAD